MAGPIKKGQILNPTGKGGFGDNPENIGNGRPKHSPQYWLNQYGKLSNAEFKELMEGFKSGSLDNQLTVNQVLALRHIAGSVKFDNRKDLLNRVDGMPTQRTEITGQDGSPFNVIINTNGYRNTSTTTDDSSVGNTE